MGTAEERAEEEASRARSTRTWSRRGCSSETRPGGSSHGTTGLRYGSDRLELAPATRRCGGARGAIEAPASTAGRRTEVLESVASGPSRAAAEVDPRRRCSSCSSTPARLVRVPPDLFFARDALDELTSRVRDFFATNREMKVARPQGPDRRLAQAGGAVARVLRSQPPHAAARTTSESPARNLLPSGAQRRLPRGPDERPAASRVPEASEDFREEGPRGSRRVSQFRARLESSTSPSAT